MRGELLFVRGVMGWKAAGLEWWESTHLMSLVGGGG